MTVYRVRNYGGCWLFVLGSVPGMLVGLVVADWSDLLDVRGLLCVLVGASLTGLVAASLARNYNCSGGDCGAPVSGRAKECPGCGGTFGGNISERQRRQLAAEELEERAAGFEWECEECRPELPCREHASEGTPG